MEPGYIPRNPTPADGSIAVIAEDTELSWDNAIDNLDNVEVWFVETVEPNELDPNSFLTSANYKDKLTLIETVTAPEPGSSVAIPTLTNEALYPWVVDGFDAPEGDPNYPGVFWTFEATDNTPLIADAGPDQYVWLDPNSVIVTLDGSASDDGDADPTEPLSFT